jgi:hypothetical protein
MAAAAVLGATWLAVRLARSDEWRAVAVTFAGCVVAYAAVVVALPRSASAREMSVLRDAADQLALGGKSELVMYQTFLRGLPWLLQRPVAFVDPGGELTLGVKSPAGRDCSLAWTEERFWHRWHHGPRIMALVREKDMQEFEQEAGQVPFVHARARQHLLVANLPPRRYPSRDPGTSTALYASELGGKSTPVMIASVPPRILYSARRELGGRPVVRCWVEPTERGNVYEVAGGGPMPRLVEVYLDGHLIYTEELFDQRELPHTVAAALKRVAPRSAVVFVKRERPSDHGLARYEILVSDGAAIREVEIDAAGRLAD